MKPVLTTALLLSVLTTAGIAAAERPSVSTPERFARDLQRVRVEVAKPAHDRVATPAAVSHAPRPAALARVTNAGGQIDRAERNHVSRASSASRAAGAAVPQARTPKAGGEVCKPSMNCAEGTGSSRSQSSARAHGAAAQGLAFGAKGTTIEQMRGKEVSKRLLERMRGAMAAHAAAAGHMVDPGSSLEGRTLVPGSRSRARRRMASVRPWGYETRVATTHIRLDITGMSCSSCVKHVTKALSRQAGVQAVDVQLDAARAEITAEDTVSADALVAAVREAGYEAKVAS